MLRTAAKLLIWVAALALFGDLALYAHGFASSSLLAMAAASAVAVLGKLRQGISVSCDGSPMLRSGPMGRVSKHEASPFETFRFACSSG
jgi:hypothetical protein